MNYHKAVKQIIDILTNNHCWFETFEHEPVATSEEAAKVRHGYSLAQGAKAIIVRAKMAGGEKRFIMLVLPGDCRFDNDKVKNATGAKDIRFATKEEINTVTDEVQIGGVPPFGNLFGLSVFADQKVFDQEKIIFNAGDQRFSIAMYSKDFQNIVNPQVVSII
ncbi:hypothetical protein MUP32_00550 [Candidatus Microgenomates bacterium]|nr:hypothetical protein [Candidatus Microgenomates bacterium]